MAMSFNPYAAFESLGLMGSMQQQEQSPSQAPTRTANRRGREQQQQQQKSAPTAELSENNTMIRLTVDLPGVLAKDLDVGVQNGVLSITGSRKTMSVDNTTCLKKLKFTRRYAVDTDVVDVSQLTANLSHGVLTIKAPKRPRHQGVIRINVTETCEEGNMMATLQDTGSANVAVHQTTDQPLLPLSMTTTTAPSGENAPDGTTAINAELQPLGEATVRAHVPEPNNEPNQVKEEDSDGSKH